MALAYSIFTSSGVRIEVDGGAVHTDYGSEFAKSIQSILSLLTSTFSAIQEGERPDQISMKFGLTAVAGGGYAISLGTEKANFRMHFSWGQSKEPGLPGLDIFPQGATTDAGESP